MNSVIIQKITGCFKKTCQFLEESAIYKAVSAVCERFSGWWNQSIGVSVLKKDITGNSVLYKIMHTPVAIFDALSKKSGKIISKSIQKSIMLDYAKIISNNVLALNTRFIGCALLLGSVVSNVISIFSKGFDINKLYVAIIGVILLLLKNINATDYLDSSWIIIACKKLLGLDVNIAGIYKNNEVGTKKALIIAIIVGIYAGLLPPLWGAVTIAGIAGAAVILSCPLVGVFAAVISAPFIPTMALAGICVITSIALVVKAVTTEGFVWRKEGIGIGFFLLILLVSSLFSFAPLKSLMVWGMYLIFGGFFFVILNVVRTKEQVYSLLRVFALAGAFVALYGVLQYIFRWNVTNAWIDQDMFSEATMRAYSTMENPNVLGEYLLILIPIASIFMLKKDNKKSDRIRFGIIFFLGILCMVFTQSRGCWLGLLLAIAIFISFYNGKLWGWIPVALLALPFILPETMMDRMMSVGNMEDSSTSYRVYIWKGTFDMLKDFWVGGIGMGEGAFGIVYPIYKYSAIDAPHSHNTFLQLVVEAGIGALFIFLGMMITFIQKVSSIFKSSDKQSMESLTALTICSGICGFLLQSLFDYTFYNYRMLAMFFMILALGITLKVCKGEEE